MMRGDGCDAREGIGWDKMEWNGNGRSDRDGGTTFDWLAGPPLK